MEEEARGREVTRTTRGEEVGGTIALEMVESREERGAEGETFTT